VKGKIPNMLVRGYHRYINKGEFSVEDGLPYWRERIFNGLMLVLFFFGTIAIVPNMIASIKTNSHLITVTNTVIYIFILILFYNNSLKFRLKISIVIFFIYVLSIVLLTTLGPMGPGLVWLASGSLIAALLLGMRASITTMAINVLIIAVLAVLIRLKVLDTQFFSTYTPMTWIAVSMNVIVFNSITSIPLALLINALENTLKNEKLLKKELIRQNSDIEQEKNQAQHSDRLKSAFLANLSHEIRTPMNAIVGFSELIKNECSSDDKLTKYSTHVVQNSKYLLDLINDIVDISIIESGQVVLNYRQVKLGTLLDELKVIIDSSNIRKSRERVEVIYQVSASLKELEMYIDGTRLLQILINLLTNALKYTPEGAVKLKVNKVGKLLNFDVSDTGVGIPLDEQHKIFQRFSKIDHRKHFNMPGIGLGLSITRGLCEAMKGSIRFESEVSRGTTFYVSLPVSIK
jgi:signal transduction histidine kinase